MSVRKAQNQVRKKYGIGKTKLHKRMSRNHTTLSTLAYQAQWGDAWAETFDEKTKQRMHDLVDALAADCIIATAYREAEKAARAELGETDPISVGNFHVRVVVDPVPLQE